jgi:acetyltransferase-like isoleucine patch superfamily enzyme
MIHNTHGSTERQSLDMTTNYKLSGQEFIGGSEKARSEKAHIPGEDVLQFLPSMITKLNSLWIRYTYPFASVGNKASFHHTSKIFRPRSTRISLGNGVSLREFAWLSVATEDPTGEPVIVLEDNCHVGFGSILSARNRIYLERDVLVGQMVLVVDHNHAYEDINVPVINQGITEGGKIRIGQGTWIGHGASIICPRGELVIGRNCVIAANSMVTRSIPDYSVVAGYPATIIRQYDPERGIWRAGGRERKTAQHAENDNESQHGTAVSGRV